MAEQTFRYKDDELLVVAEGETVGFITQGHDREDLDHDEVRKLIEFLQEVVGEGLTAEPGLTHRALDGMPEGSEVYDDEMEKWIKYGTEWKYYVGTLYRSSVDLIEQYGPITACKRPR